MRAEQSSAAVVVAAVTPTKQDDLDVMEAIGETAAGIESAVGGMFFCEPTVSRYAWTGCHSYGTINWADDVSDDLDVDQGEVEEVGDWKWHGSDKPSTGKGTWINGETGEKIHFHPYSRKHGPHTDYTDPDGNEWRLYPDGRRELKR